MKTVLLLPLAIAALTAIACGDDGGGTGGSGNSGNSGGSTSSSGSGGTGSASGGMGAGGSPYGDICNDDYMDNTCVTCTQGACCDELEACTMDTPCQCLLDCFLAGTDPPMCLSMCPSSDAVNNLVACATAGCGMDCT
ncbi:MAG: hypothetical protein KC731_20115 [Myxococcales bacterium]|nr:hypothetical protein [Myxococcales bacterium]